MRSFAKSEGGQDFIEHALVFPIFILLVLSVMEAGWLFLQYSALTNVAREGARGGLLPITGSCPLSCRISQADSVAHGFADAAGLDDIVIDASSSTSSVSRVTVTLNAQLLTRPIIQAAGGTGTIELATTATMNRE